MWLEELKEAVEEEVVEEEEESRVNNSKHSWRRWQQQLALQGWGPALRGLGHDAAKEEERFSEALALFHLAGTHRRDSRAFYEVGALLEARQEQFPFSSSSSSSSSLSILALEYYHRSMQVARGPYRLPPLLAFLHLYLRTEARPAVLRYLRAWWSLGWVVEELALWLALLMLGNVVSVLRTRRQRWRDTQATRQREENEAAGAHRQERGQPSQPASLAAAASLTSAAADPGIISSEEEEEEEKNEVVEEEPQQHGRQAKATTAAAGAMVLPAAAAAASACSSSSSSSSSNADNSVREMRNPMNA